MHQDQEGFIWSGTRMGLIKYDGKDIRTFTRKDGLLADYVYEFYEDKQGRIWIHNFNGEPMFIQNGILHNRITDPYLSQIQTKLAQTILFQDTEERLWFINKENALSYIKNKKRSDWAECKTLIERYDTKVTFAFEYKSDIYFLTKDKLFKSNSELKTIEEP